ncbi:hypothetical protein DICVIV_08151 [Dictyocaulus viviparus]|uniref:Uncharacterized protein n=1 Tax=Dictyocaulus viviparus TaxID=29172 RepID=A0A0D8XPY0_DICVI|nr:hypothetical protein DICVIV_08151 [Dictyocaulus viviparus]
MPMAADRRAVAEYARAYGGAAAAKRFGIPPPVSTYYHRKESNSALLAAVTASPGPSSEGEAEATIQPTVPENSIAAPSQLPSSMPNISNSISSIQQPSSTPGALPTSQSQATSVSAPNPAQAASGMFSPAMVDMLRMNAAHATGSPGFLRGRGRGRPKLIGDELDADLVDYMVTVKQADPHGHLTASQALIIAKQYILEKAPGLLEEHGGHVKLKLTWAMKLVSRIAERQKEMELGLPAGSLSNMGRHQLNSLNNSLTGGGFMADMMTQNIFSHHMMMNMNSQIKQEIPNTEEPKEDVQPTVGAPEILNIKELNLPFLNNLFGGSDENSGLIEGELPAENDQEMNLADAAH